MADAPALAQATPGGVADPVVWVKADDPGTISVAWRDHSPQGRDVEAVGSWNVSPADRAHNFNPFTNGFTQTRLFRDNSSFASNSLVIQSMASFAAFRRTGSTAGRLTGVSSIADAVEEPGLSITSTGMLRWYKYLEGTDSLTSSVVTPLNRSAVGSFTSNQTTKLVEVGVNGAFNSKTFAGNSAVQGPFLAIGYGVWDSDGADGPFPGDVMEVIWYRRTITSNERDRISSYLAIKYGTTLSSSYLSSSGSTIWNFAAAPSFNQNIAGIGLDQTSGLHQKQANSINSGDQVIVSLGSNVAASNASNIGGFTVDRSFAMWGDNAGSTAYSIATTVGAATYNRMARTWRLQQSGTVPQTTVAYPYSGTDNVHLIISNTSDFSGTNTVVAMPTTQVIEGTAYRTTAAPISFGANTFFTFATTTPDPLAVINTNDTGAGSLRNAIAFANTQGGPVTISFAIPGAGPHTITLASALPDITSNGLTIDGTTQSGTQCRDLWTGNGHDLRINVRGNSGFDGFRLSGANQTVKGLAISGFADAIELLPASSNAAIQCNYLGLQADGSSSGNGWGVWAGGTSARIGGLGPGEGNVISANTTAGVVTISGSTDTAIRGNFIGTDAAGMSARANGTGINHYSGSATWRDITYNLISGNNGNAGIVLEADDSISPSNGVIRIQRNRIGLNRTFTALLRNSGDGIGFAMNSISNVLIGGNAATEGNDIASLADAIDIRGASNVTIQGNIVGLSVGHAIWFESVSNATIGGVAGSTGNQIGGFGSDGIHLRNGSNNITVTGNLIQPVQTGLGTSNNQGNGIAMNDVSAITIGDGTAAGRNVIGGNRRRGITGLGAVSNLTINGNYIGTDSSGNLAVTNGQIEGTSRRDAISFDNGAYSNIAILNNVIGGYTGSLIELFNTTATGITIQGNNLGVGADGTSQIVSANTEDLIHIGGSPRDYSNVLIGGSGAGQGNTIAFSNRSGIRLQSSGSNIQVIGNTIRNNNRNGIYVIDSTTATIFGNRIFSSGLIGIDLNEDGVTANDPGDGDSGPNNLLNFPEFTALNIGSGGQLSVALTLDAPAETNGYRIDLYRNGSPDPTGFGEGSNWLGSFDTPAHGGGAVAFTGSITPLSSVVAGTLVSATATRKTGAATYAGTSEFNQNGTVVTPLIVTNVNDNGAGSLRNAIDFANTQGGPVTVSFAVPGAGPHTITVSSALPDITANGLTIDGTTQSGAQCRDLLAGNGHDLRVNLQGSTGFAGLRLTGTNQTVKGLAIGGFGRGILLAASSNTATIQCNYLGLMANGTSNGNNQRGIDIFGASARIGGLGPGEGNVVSANAFGVITNSGSTDTSISGNFIGTDHSGMAARANGNGINNVSGSATWREIIGNLIAGNNGAGGISLETDDVISPSNGVIRIQRNRIGLNLLASALLLNGGQGIFFPDGSISNVLIGGAASSEGNEIAGMSNGILAMGVTNVTIQGNTVTQSGDRGIVLTNVNGAAIGGTSAGMRNLVTGNAGNGIDLRGGSSNISVLGNIIGWPVADNNLENGGHGILLDAVSNVTIGDGTAAGRNLITGNRRRGIVGLGTVSNVTINGNYIGTDATGNAASTANGQTEGTSRRDAISFDSGAYSSIAILNNVIGGYTGSLVELFNTTATGITIQGNNLGVGANGTSQIVSGNTEDLIYIGGNPRDYSNVLIGGSGAGQGNTIAFSNRSGIRLQSSGNNIQVIGNTIRNNTRNGIYLLDTTAAAFVSNRIYANGMLGIDLGENGVTANDAGDGDTGPNNLLNFPQNIRAVVTNANQLTYRFTLDAPADSNGYRIEFFSNSAADASGFGQGENYLGHVDITHAGGAQTYSGSLATLQPISIGQAISATATRRTAGGAWDISSEFSAVATADGVAALSVTVTSEVYNPPSGNPFATPGNDLLLTTTVRNTGTGSTDNDTVFVVVSINAASAFFNGTTSEFGGVVGFQSGSPALTFTPATDLRFSDSTTAPTSFAQCTYTPAAGYDPQVRYVCLNPKGSLPIGASEGQFSVRMRAQTR